MRRVGERTSYAPGVFCWTDLGTTDAAGAVAFYSGLFGWEPVEMPGGGGYTLMRLGGADVCGVYGLPEGARTMPAWTSYVAVEDAAATVTAAVALGAGVARDTVDVMELGRSAAVTDPQGALLGLWEAGSFIGAGRVNDVGTMVLNQLNTSDPDAAAAFYSELLGWEVTQVQTQPAPYWGITAGGHLNGGMMGLAPPAPPNWLVYFTSEDLDGSDALIVDLGGAVVVPPMAIQDGRILVARDPQYGFFALYEGEVDP